ncbi:hypothetical protein PENSPDRAFT_146518 [Peniophora sp. CONT]|nr:hypothetical protein PENSPDRAFT_146518 [Peniophora sp. CONT]
MLRMHRSLLIISRIFHAGDSWPQMIYGWKSTCGKTDVNHCCRLIMLTPHRFTVCFLLTISLTCTSTIHCISFACRGLARDVAGIRRHPRYPMSISRR